MGKGAELERVAFLYQNSQNSTASIWPYLYIHWVISFAYPYQCCKSTAQSNAGVGNLQPSSPQFPECPTPWPLCVHLRDVVGKTSGRWPRLAGTWDLLCTKRVQYSTWLATELQSLSCTSPPEKWAGVAEKHRFLFHRFLSFQCDLHKKKSHSTVPSYLHDTSGICNKVLQWEMMPFRILHSISPLLPCSPLTQCTQVQSWACYILMG